jgi:radical SAM protein (TIGR04043 family)
VSVGTRVDVAILGVRVDAPVRRSGGAGPSDDGHLLVGGAGAAIPLNPDSPYLVRDGSLWLGETDLDLPVRPILRPRFYDLVTADGIPYEKIARLHGSNVLATTVVQTCIRYGEADRCRFCTIEESLRAGATIGAKTPAQLAEVAEAAVRLDGIKQMVMTTGTTSGPDRGARVLARSVRAVLAAVPGLPIQVQCEPPTDLAWITELKEAGAAAIGIHIESLDESVRARWMPGKATVPVAAYDAAWDEAVRVFGPNRVSTYLLAGLGEDPDDLVEGAADLIARGIYPFVVPYRPMKDSLAGRDGAAGPDPAVVSDITTRVGALLSAAGMSGAEQGAGCAACGACSALQTAGG